MKKILFISQVLFISLIFSLFSAAQAQAQTQTRASFKIKNVGTTKVNVNIRKADGSSAGSISLTPGKTSSRSGYVGGRLVYKCKGKERSLIVGKRDNNFTVSCE